MFANYGDSTMFGSYLPSEQMTSDMEGTANDCCGHFIPWFQSAACCTCKIVTLDSDAAVFLIMPLLITERYLKYYSVTAQ